jgi:separase
VANFRLSQLYALRGTARSATFFADQAIQLADDLGAQHVKAQALALRAELSIYQGESQKALDDLNQAVTVASQVRVFLFDRPMATDSLLIQENDLAVIEVDRLRADLHVRLSLLQDADRSYVSAQEALDRLNLAFAEFEARPQRCVARPSNPISLFLGH